MDELHKQQLQVQEIPSGIAVILPHVLFAYKSTDLLPDARRHIDHIAIVLNHRRASGRRVSVEGHADAIGSDQYNFELSQKRAETVAQELIACGVRRERVAIKSFGKQRPLAPNSKPDGTDNPEGRAQNRRVEVVILH
jgi:outer membrane protein OmpA-like peptidoglycan-associated protein